MPTKSQLVNDLLESLRQQKDYAFSHYQSAKIALLQAKQNVQQSKQAAEHAFSRYQKAVKLYSGEQMGVIAAFDMQQQQERSLMVDEFDDDEEDEDLGGDGFDILHSRNSNDFSRKRAPVVAPQDAKRNRSSSIRRRKSLTTTEQPNKRPQPDFDYTTSASRISRRASIRATEFLIDGESDERVEAEVAAAASKKRRGRPHKNVKTNSDSSSPLLGENEMTTKEDAQDEKLPARPPRKRGRSPKNQTVEEPNSASKDPPKSRRGRPPKRAAAKGSAKDAPSAPVAAELPLKPRRGRQPKTKSGDVANIAALTEESIEPLKSKPRGRPQAKNGKSKGGGDAADNNARPTLGRRRSLPPRNVKVPSLNTSSGDTGTKMTRRRSASLPPSKQEEGVRGDDNMEQASEAPADMLDLTMGHDDEDDNDHSDPNARLKAKKDADRSVLGPSQSNDDGDDLQALMCAATKTVQQEQQRLRDGVRTSSIGSSIGKSPLAAAVAAADAEAARTSALRRQQLPSDDEATESDLSSAAALRRAAYQKVALSGADPMTTDTIEKENVMLGNAQDTKKPAQRQPSSHHQLAVDSRNEAAINKPSTSVQPHVYFVQQGNTSHKSPTVGGANLPPAKLPLSETDYDSPPDDESLPPITPIVLMEPSGLSDSNPSIADALKQIQYRTHEDENESRLPPLTSASGQPTSTTSIAAPATAEQPKKKRRAVGVIPASSSKKKSKSKDLPDCGRDGTESPPQHHD